MNWNVVCNGGATMAALALADVPRYAAAAADALGFAAAGIPAAISGYGPAIGGGASPEGSGYWGYASKWLLATAETLVTATAHDNGYMSSAGVNETAGFALQMYFTPSSDVFNYGDTPDMVADALVASILLGLVDRFPGLGRAVVDAAHSAAVAPTLDAAGWDDVALCLMRWNPATISGAPKNHGELPTAAFYEAQAVGVVRSGWSPGDSYLAARGGNSTVTHQDLDHGSFVWESRGYRWAIDLGTENYGLPNIFLPFQGRYRYYRKATRGHNTLTFGDPGGFDPAVAEKSDQAVNVFSPLVAGAACNRQLKGHVCGNGVVMVVNLTSAYAPRLPNGLPDPAAPDTARTAVVRTFALDAGRAALRIRDAIAGGRDNLSWAFHTRVPSVVLHGDWAELISPAGLRMEARTRSTPDSACSNWEAEIVRLPNGTQHDKMRFPLDGVKKLWVVCHRNVTAVEVTMRDL